MLNTQSSLQAHAELTQDLSNMAGLSISGNTNSKPVNNDGGEYRHPDNVSPIMAKPQPIQGPNIQNKDNDNDGDRKWGGYSNSRPAPKWQPLGSPYGK